RARDFVAVPDRVRGRAHHGAPVGGIAQAEPRPPLQGAGDLATGGERVAGEGVVEILVRTRDQEPDRARRQGLFAAAPPAPRATARAVASSACSSPSSRKRSISRTYS